MIKKSSKKIIMHVRKKSIYCLADDFLTEFEKKKKLKMKKKDKLRLNYRKCIVEFNR